MRLGFKYENRFFFSLLTCIGLVLWLFWAAGSHGHLQFRANMTQDWLAYGVPTVGLTGLFISISLHVSKRSKEQGKYEAH